LIDFEVHDGKFKWGNHIETHLKNPTPHEPSEKEVIEALKSVHTFKVEHNTLHLYNADEKDVLVFHKKE